MYIIYIYVYIYIYVHIYIYMYIYRYIHLWWIHSIGCCYFMGRHDDMSSRSANRPEILTSRAPQVPSPRWTSLLKSEEFIIYDVKRFAEKKVYIIYIYIYIWCYMIYDITMMFIMFYQVNLPGNWPSKYRLIMTCRSYDSMTGAGSGARLRGISWLSTIAWDIDWPSKTVDYPRGIWRFPKLVLPQARWMVYFMENPFNIDVFLGPPIDRF